MRGNVDRFKNVFARPYLEGDDLKRDRALVRHLNHLRTKYKDTGRIFKISRNAIHEVINTRLVKLEMMEEDTLDDATSTGQPRTRTTSITSVGYDTAAEDNYTTQDNGMGGQSSDEGKESEELAPAPTTTSQHQDG